jgi:hypothetical protein
MNLPFEKSCVGGEIGERVVDQAVGFSVPKNAELNK